MTAVLPERRPLAAMSELEMSAAFGAGEITAEQVEREMARRENAAAARARRRFQYTDWHGAAFGNYAAAEAYCHGDHNMLSEAGRRTGRSPWPMLWQGSEEAARRLASEELLA